MHVFEIYLLTPLVIGPWAGVAASAGHSLPIRIGCGIGGFVVGFTVVAFWHAVGAQLKPSKARRIAWWQRRREAPLGLLVPIASLMLLSPPLVALGVMAGVRWALN